MPRPPSHRDQFPERCCQNCRHSVEPQYKDHRLCLFGDSFTQEQIDDFWMMDDYDYGKQIWGGHVVDEDDICDEWAPKDAGAEEARREE